MGVPRPPTDCSPPTRGVAKGESPGVKDASVRGRLCAGSPPTQRTAAAVTLATRTERAPGGTTPPVLPPHRPTANPGEGLVGTGTTGLFGPRGNNSGRFASSQAVTAMTAAACLRSPGIA